MEFVNDNVWAVQMVQQQHSEHIRELQVTQQPKCCIEDDRLVDAAEVGNLALVKELLKYVDPDSRRSLRLRQDTALHRAAKEGFDQIVRVLLAAGASVDAQNSNGDTPLHKAVWQGRLSTVKVLIANGASLTIEKINGQTAFIQSMWLMYTAYENRIKIFKHFIRNGADLTTIYNGKNPYELAHMNGFNISEIFPDIN